MSAYLSFDIVLQLFFGGVIGLCLGLTGVGGGVLIIPILQVFFGMHAVMAVGTASLISTLVKVSAGIAHIRAGNIKWKEAGLILLGAIPCVLLTTELIVLLNQSAYYSELVNQAIESAIVLMMLLSLVSLYLKSKHAGTESNPVPRRKSYSIAIGGGCGAVLGSTGVGGGVMLLPAFNTLLGVDIKKAIGSSVVVALVLSGVTAMSYSRGGQSDWPVAVVMTSGAILSMPVAMRLVKAFTPAQLYRLTIGVILVALAMVLFFR
ncbi:sulfite exporter TauE/SafE family protein [Photobacterium rosenbergii]|uniref:Probable membrane transporter protein n=1 Tax=Photobacterium rosenbergii TaxID=294936 RepID=A0ABU3ZIQ8_9GAMM|nr:sulfite exporter TauE/SafE family protein [Photobacterium rosenbergii]MDV5170010.1 sulfite exporter TauE/SafE family protein [Photobacterium rosenbergii]